MNKKANPFKEKIKIAMLKKGLNQTKMAKLLGISNQAFSAWLSDCPNPKVQTLKRVAKILGTPDNYFFANTSYTDEKTLNTVNERSDNYIIAMLQKDMEIVKKEIEIIKLKINK